MGTNNRGKERLFKRMCNEPKSCCLFASEQEWTVRVQGTIKEFKRKTFWGGQEEF